MAALAYTRGEAYLFFKEQIRLDWLKVRGENRATAAVGAGSAVPARAGAGAVEAGGENREADFALSLSQSGSVLEAAANLFECLHRLEKLSPHRIHAESLPEEGLGEAVNDRLRRASVGTV
jgi:hypothetical protein